MELRDTVTGITAAAVVGTGSIVGGGHVIDNIMTVLKREEKQNSLNYNK